MEDDWYGKERKGRENWVKNWEGKKGYWKVEEKEFFCILFGLWVGF